MSFLSLVAMPDVSHLVLAIAGSFVGGVTTLAVMIARNWCKILPVTVAVLHSDPQRREDALEVYERTVAAESGPPGTKPTRSGRVSRARPGPRS
jgi:hypothetical protein